MYGDAEKVGKSRKQDKAISTADVEIIDLEWTSQAPFAPHLSVCLYCFRCASIVYFVHICVCVCVCVYLSLPTNVIPASLVFGAP